MTRQEAIDKLKHLCSPEQMTALKVLVPELQESKDEEIREELIGHCKDLVRMNRDDKVMLSIYEPWLAWLEKQKEPQQEWSEEDEKKITFLERLIRYNVPEGQYGWTDGHKGEFITKLEAISILKSLRPRPHWKPSEEQMTNLLRAEWRLKIEGESVLASKLAELYEKLKKLI